MVTKQSVGWVFGMALVTAVGCAADPALRHAQNTLALSTEATENMALAQTPSAAASTSTDVQTALAEAQQRLSEAEEALDLWLEDRGSLAWTTLIPCLARALSELRDVAVHSGQSPPIALEQAIEMAAEASDGVCAAPRSERPRQPTEIATRTPVR